MYRGARKRKKRSMKNKNSTTIEMEVEVASVEDAMRLAESVRANSKSVTKLNIKFDGTEETTTDNAAKPTVKADPRLPRRRGRPPLKSKKARKHVKYTKSLQAKRKVIDRNLSKDSRAVWRLDKIQNKNVLEVDSTLANLNLSRAELLGMPTKYGTLEFTLKRTILGQRSQAIRKEING